MPRRPFSLSSPSAPTRGLALLLVLILSAILLPFAVEFSMQVHLEARTATNVTDQLKIDNEIDGQYEIMLARLRFDAQSNEVDSYGDEWNSEELRNRSSETTQVSLTTYVFDEQGKMNLRQLAEAPPERKQIVKDRLIRLLEGFRRDTDIGLSRGDAESWATAIMGYVSKGAMHSRVPVPKMSDDRAILILDELNFLPEIRGHRFDFLMADQRDDDRTAPGLHRFVTVYGNGKVNLNTAPQVVLEAFFELNPELAERIIERRDSPPDGEDAPASSDSETDAEATSNPFTDVAEITQIEGIDPEVLQENKIDPTLDFEVVSNFFSFRIVGESASTRRDELFVVERVPGAAEGEPIEGFRLLLRQERTDPLEQGDEDQ